MANEVKIEPLGKLIDQKGPNKDGRRNPIAPQQDGCNGQTRRRPDGCGARVKRGKPQSEIGKREIRKPYKDQRRTASDPSGGGSRALLRVGSASCSTLMPTC